MLFFPEQKFNVQYLLTVLRSGKQTPTRPISPLFTWFIRAIFTVTVVIVHLLKWDHLRPINAQKGLPLPVEALVC